jgi:hypothetical protein
VAFGEGITLYGISRSTGPVKRGANADGRAAGYPPASFNRNDSANRRQLSLQMIGLRTTACRSNRVLSDLVETGRRSISSPPTVIFSRRAARAASDECKKARPEERGGGEYLCHRLVLTAIPEWSYARIEFSPLLVHVYPRRSGRYRVQRMQSGDTICGPCRSSAHI